MPDGQPVWPIEFEDAFAKAVATAQHMRHHLPSCGFRGRFDMYLWIAVAYYRRTDLMRSRGQICSHLQQRRKWFMRTRSDGMSWDEFIGVKYGYIVEDDDYDHIGEDEGDEPFNIIDHHEAYDHSRSTDFSNWATYTAFDWDSTSAALATSMADWKLAPTFEKIALVPSVCDA